MSLLVWYTRSLNYVYLYGTIVCALTCMYAMNMQLRNFLHLLFSIFRVFNEFVAEGHSIILAVWTGAF